MKDWDKLFFYNSNNLLYFLKPLLFGISNHENPDYRERNWLLLASGWVNAEILIIPVHLVMNLYDNMGSSLVEVSVKEVWIKEIINPDDS